MKLPEPVDFSDAPEHAHVWGYTEAQMREMYQKGLEDAAKLCTNSGWTEGYVFAEDIRKLKEQE